MSLSNKRKDEEIINNSKTDYLYCHEFEYGRFFTVVFEDENGFEIKLSPRTMMKVVYIKDKNDIEGLEIIKQSDRETQRVKFSKFNFAQLKAFLEFIEKSDLKSIFERRTKLSIADELNEETKNQIEKLLSNEDGSQIIKEILDKGIVTSKDIVNTGYRKQQLEIFRKLLDDDYIQEYKEIISKMNTKNEMVWQYFFNKNPWIFGYGLDYRFQGILQKEFHASDTNASGKEGVIADFLIGDNNFTTFVELKLPTTELFGKEKNRSNAWRLSNKLIDSVSQILEQKASGQIKIETNKEFVDDNYNTITQHAYDSKAILIIGNWNEVDQSNEPDGIKKIKRKTFELFRRDSRNIEIITYDELLNRAKFIVDEHNKTENEDLDDLPF